MVIQQPQKNKGPLDSSSHKKGHTEYTMETPQTYHKPLCLKTSLLSTSNWTHLDTSAQEGQLCLGCPLDCLGGGWEEDASQADIHQG